MLEYIAGPIGGLLAGGAGGAVLGSLFKWLMRRGTNRAQILQADRADLTVAEREFRNSLSSELARMREAHAEATRDLHAAQAELATTKRALEEAHTDLHVANERIERLEGLIQQDGGIS